MSANAIRLSLTLYVWMIYDRRGSRGGVRGVRTPPLVIKVLHFYCKTALSQRQSLRRCPLRMPFEKTLNPPLQEILDPRLIWHVVRTPYMVGASHGHRAWSLYSLYGGEPHTGTWPGVCTPCMEGSLTRAPGPESVLPVWRGASHGHLAWSLYSLYGGEPHTGTWSGVCTPCMEGSLTRAPGPESGLPVWRGTSHGHLTRSLYRVCLKGNIPRISSYTWRFAINTGWFVVLRSNP